VSGPDGYLLMVDFGAAPAGLVAGMLVRLPGPPAAVRLSDRGVENLNAIVRRLADDLAVLLDGVEPDQLAVLRHVSLQVVVNRQRLSRMPGATDRRHPAGWTTGHDRVDLAGQPEVRRHRRQVIGERVVICRAIRVPAPSPPPVCPICVESPCGGRDRPSRTRSAVEGRGQAP
jgi:hypothetical protein